MNIYLLIQGTGQKFKILDCVEGSNTHNISDAKLICDIIQHGDDTKAPPNDQKPIVRIQIKKNIAVNQVVEFFVAGIRNPIYDKRRAVVTVSLRKTAIQTGFDVSKKTAHQISCGEYYTTNNPNYFILGSNQATITYDANSPLSKITSTPSLTAAKFDANGKVWDKIQSHTWRIVSKSDIQTNDWIMVTYTLSNNSVMTDTCEPISQCYVFSSLGYVIMKFSGTTSDIITMTAQKMNNALYRYGGKFKVDHWKSSGELISAYEQTGITYAYDTTSITISTPIPTLTPENSSIQQNYWLTDFMNVAKFTIKGLWKYNNIKSFWLRKPKEIDFFDQTNKYCNATLSIANNDRKPYPWRFNCYVIDSTKLYLELTSEFYPYDHNNYKNFDIILYVNFYIKEFTPSGTVSSPFYFYSSVQGIAADDENYGVTQQSCNIDISDKIQPDLRSITFNSLPFKDRKAQATDKVEFYMLLQPMTALSLNRIDKMVFRIPNEFNYPAVKDLNLCKMFGKVETPVTVCELSRSYGYTYVTVVPDTTYDNTVKIIRLSDTSNQNLFTTPTLPGDFYNITAELYSNNILLERQNINITRVLGYPYVEKSVKLTSHNDPLYSNIFTLESQLGSQDIQPGYDTAAALMYTSLEYTFDNIQGQFEQDLGTGLKTGDEVPCLGGPEIKFTVKKKLTCIITVGTGPQNPPTINVFGYDKISANTIVRMYFPKIKSLAVNVEANTYTKVRIYYKWINYSAIFYETKPFTATKPTNANSITPANQDATTTTNNKVGQTRDYTFPFSLSGTLNTNDYLIFNFPADYFDRNSDYSQVTSLGFNVFVYSVSNQIFLQPKTSMTGNQNVVIQNLINPSYSQNVAINIQGYQFTSLKIVKQITFAVNKLANSPIIACSSFQKGEAIADTNIGGQNGATFTINFITGHYIPANDGAFTVLMPQEYPYNFYEMKTQCQLIGFDSRATCLVGSARRMDIFLNGNEINQNKQYSIILKNVNTLQIPNKKIILTSYFNDNIYLDQQICAQEMAYPTFTSNSINDCAMIISSTVLNANALSLYTFKFQCTQVVRDNTNIEIIIPNQYKTTNKLDDNLSCFSSEPTTLRSSECKFLQSNLQYIIRINVQAIQSQSLFSVSVYIRNPKVILPDGYQFSSNFYSYSILYAQASAQGNPIILDQEIFTTDNVNLNQIKLTNIPKNAGQMSTYTFTIPPLINYDDSNQITSVEIQFPKISELFATVLGENIECGIYLTEVYDSQFLTYKGLLSMTHGRDKSNYDFTSLPCSLSSDFTLKIDTTQVVYPKYTSPGNLKSISTLWQHLIIRNVYNPKIYNQASQFKISYFNQNSIKWQMSKNLVYSICKAPLYLRVSSILSNDKNIRVQTQYTFELISQYRLPENPLVGISVTLPKNLYNTVASLYLSKLDNCVIQKINNSKYAQKLDCDIYDLEVLAEQGNLIDLQSATNFKFVINKLINPNLEYQCTTQDINQFNVKIIDWNSGDLLFVTSPSIDDKNCLSFSKQSFDINVSGPLIVYPGLSYAYTISLEKFADNLIIRPIAPISAIIFEPETIDMSNFLTKQETFNIKYRSDILPKDYIISFELIQVEKQKSEQLNLPSSYYLPSLPLSVKVIPYNKNGSEQPTIKVENISVDTIGYPIRVPVTLSAASASTLYLSIRVVEDMFQQIIKIDPPLLQIDANVKSTYFTIQVNTQTVPEKFATISFALTSYYTIVHTLAISTKYISFSINNSFSTDYSILNIVFDKNYIATPDEDKNQTVQSLQNSSNQKVLSGFIPKVMSFEVKSTTANTADFLIYASRESTIFYTYSLYGSSKPNSIDEIRNKSYKNGIAYAEATIPRTINNNSVIDYLKLFTITKLQAQTNYQIHYFIWNQFGPSSLQSHSFKTGRISFGSIISIPIKKITAVSDIIIALSKSLQINPTRIISNTDEAKLKERDSQYDPNIMLKSSIYYDFVIAPNEFDDSTPTSSLINILKSDQETRSILSSLLPQFDLFSTINTQQIISSVPKVDVYPKPVQINYNNATFTMRLWEQGYVFAIVREIYDLDKNKDEPPVSIQIFNGKDEKNNVLSSYKIYQNRTDENGYATITVDDLNDGTKYMLMITLGSHLPYTPLNLLEDKDIIKLEFQTPFNLNLGSYQEKLEALSLVNPELADAIYRFMN